MQLNSLYDGFMVFYEDRIENKGHLTVASHSLKMPNTASIQCQHFIMI